jgi:cytidyltransferase-like protein
MRTVQTVGDLRRAVQAIRAQRRRLALVPTMGALHQGHMALIRAARQHADTVCVTIFVNPKQFGPNEDFDAYPRQMREDSAMLERVGVELLFAPPVEEMYPGGFVTTVHVARLTEGLCGADRPHHFDGVATVVTKLLLQVLPDVAMFGEKDYQQLLVVSTARARSRYPHSHPGLSDLAGGRRPRSVLAQQVSFGRAARDRALASPSPAGCRGAFSGGPRDRGPLHQSSADAARQRLRLGRLSRGPRR